MDKKAIIHFWMMSPSYFQVPVLSRLQQLKATVITKREHTAFMYELLKLQPKKERP